MREDRNAMPPISIMIKPASSLCNMRCAYCFYHDVAAHRADASFGIMESRTARHIIEKAFAYADGQPVSFAFQGGEPCLAGLAFFEEFTACAKERNTKNSPVSYGMQTNGLLLDRAFAAFLQREDFLVGLSLDGDERANRYRKKLNGENAHEGILRAARLLDEYEVPYNILTVLTGECAEHIENIYSYFKRMGFRYLQFIPCLRPFGDQSESPLYMTAGQYRKFLITLFALYAEDYARGDYISIRQFDNLVRLYLGQPAEQCGMLGHCTFQYVVEANGNVYPCDFYCLDAWRLGNIAETDFEAMHEHPRARRFIKESMRVPARCGQCRYAAMCRGGGCKRLRESADYCGAYKAFFNRCLPLFRVFEGENISGANTFSRQ